MSLFSFTSSSSGGTATTTESGGPTTNPTMPAVGGGTAGDGRQFTRNGLIDRQMAGWGDFSFDYPLNASVRTRPPIGRFTPGWRTTPHEKPAADGRQPTPHVKTVSVAVPPQPQAALSDRRNAEAEIAGDIARRAPARGGA